MPAEHITTPSDDTDALQREGCWVTITADEAGVPIVKVSVDTVAPVLVYFNDQVIINRVPDYNQHQALKEERQAELDRRTNLEKISSEVRRRLASGDPTDPTDIAVEEAVKLATAMVAEPTPKEAP